MGTRGVGHRAVTAHLECGEAALDITARQEDMAAARLAPKPDVRAHAVHEPPVTAARVGFAQAEHVAEQQLEHGSV